jgi:hypothetical protein
VSDQSLVLSASAAAVWTDVTCSDGRACQRRRRLTLSCSPRMWSRLRLYHGCVLEASGERKRVVFTGRAEEPMFKQFWVDWNRALRQEMLEAGTRHMPVRRGVLRREGARSEHVSGT